MGDSDSRERRKHKRLKCQKEVILITPYGMHSIHDISAGGLAFNCPSDEALPAQWPVEIIVAETPIYMKGISVRLIREELSTDQVFLSPPAKKVGVEFLELDQHNKNLLDKLLAQHTQAMA